MATVTAKGIEATARNLAGVSPLDPFLYMATGSGTTLAEDSSNTALETENTTAGLGRVAATCVYLGANKIRWSYKYLLSGSATISEAGVFNAASAGAGDMFLRHVLTAPISVNTGDELEIIFIHTMTD